MRVRTDDGRELTGVIPVDIRRCATTLAGRRVQFSAVVDDDTGTFRRPVNGTILPPPHLSR